MASCPEDFQVIVSIADGNRVADLDPHGFCPEGQSLSLSDTAGYYFNGTPGKLDIHRSLESFLDAGMRSPNCPGLV